MPNPTTLQSSPGLSDITGAYDHGHWETVTAQLKPASGVLLRGSVLSSVATDGGKLTLTVAGSEATAYGILLNASADTGVANSTGTVTASVARAGSFKGAALHTGAGTDVAALSKQLRLLGIFVEGAFATPGTLMAATAEEESKDERPVSSKESHERRQREEDEERRRHQKH